MVSNFEKIKDLGLEFKAVLIFGGSALILSLTVGLIFGNDILNALFKALIMTLIFGAIGYGIIFIIKIFVPEIYEILNSPPESENSEAIFQKTAEQTPVVDSTEVKSDDDKYIEESIDDTTEKEFKPFEETEFKKYESVEKMKEGKLGKHIVVDEKKVKYEPKIVAEAIRTMMKRDKD